MTDTEGPLVVLGGLALFMLLLLGLMYLDARSFADECIRAGGYVASDKTCIRP